MNDKKRCLPQMEGLHFVSDTVFAYNQAFAGTMNWR